MPPSRKQGRGQSLTATLSDILFRNCPPDWWENFAQDPLHVIARRAFATCTTNLPLYPSPDEDDPGQGEPTTKSRPPPPDRARVVCISDTHNRHAELPPLPPGDILIHAGDLTDTGTDEELDAALAWLAAAPHKHKIVVAGNHGTGLEVLPPSKSQTPSKSTTCASDSTSTSESDSRYTSETERRDALLRRHPSVTYLEDSSTVLEVRGRLLCVHDSPRTPLFRPSSSARAFQYATGANPGFSWRRHLPPLTDILVTHGPPAAHLDWWRGVAVGCPGLLQGLRRTRPRLHVCGHVHAGRGVRVLPWSRAQRWYERACAPGAGCARRAYFTLLVVCAAAGTRFGAAVGRRPSAGPAPLPGRPATVLVNAASAGGYAMQGAIVVDVPLPERL